MNPQECCVLIPSLSPDERLPEYVQALRGAGFGLVLVVDDGSAETYQEIFSRIAAWLGCHVLHHGVNRGKGAALRTGRLPHAVLLVGEAGCGAGFAARCLAADYLYPQGGPHGQQQKLPQSH